VKSLLRCLVLASMSFVTARAQVSVEVTLPQEHFLPCETMNAVVRITNRSGQKLHLGAEPDWLRFDLESRDGLIVARNSEPEVLGEFDLETSKVAVWRVDLAPHFVLTQVGRYSVTATVKIKAWDREVASKPKPFDIIHGAKIWEQEFGVPSASEAPNATPEVRKYILEQANYLRGQLRLYMRLTDSSGARTFGVFRLGQIVSFGQPKAQIDKECNLHVLFANGPHSFLYTTFNPQGDLLARDTYDYSDTRPKLQLSDAGKVFVTGGARRVSASVRDAPPPLIPPPDPEKTTP
jgi:hypothetical protein